MVILPDRASLRNIGLFEGALGAPRVHAPLAVGQVHEERLGGQHAAFSRSAERAGSFEETFHVRAPRERASKAG
jgi:hypothetical protein